MDHLRLGMDAAPRLPGRALLGERHQVAHRHQHLSGAGAAGADQISAHSWVSRRISSLISVSASVGTTSQTTCSTTSRERASTASIWAALRPSPPSLPAKSAAAPLPAGAAGGLASGAL